MTETKTFGAFVRQCAKAGVDIASAVAVYVEKHEDDCSRVRERIEAACRAGRITEPRRDLLQRCVDACLEAHKSYGRIVDHADPADWVDLGNGARMHRVHKDSDSEISPFVERTGAYRRALGAFGRRED
jgi:hypothetical protein